jgi:hypothetical protein
LDLAILEHLYFDPPRAEVLLEKEHRRYWDTPILVLLCFWKVSCFPCIGSYFS